MKEKKVELKGGTNARPIRFDAESDLTIKQAMQERQLNNYNMTVNFIVHQYKVVLTERLAAKDRLQKEMLKWGFRGKEFDF